MAVHAYNPDTWEAEEDLTSILGYRAKPCLKKREAGWVGKRPRKPNNLRPTPGTHVEMGGAQEMAQCSRAVLLFQKSQAQLQAAQLPVIPGTLMPLLYADMYIHTYWQTQVK